MGLLNGTGRFIQGSTTKAAAQVAAAVKDAAPRPESTTRPPSDFAAGKPFAAAGKMDKTVALKALGPRKVSRFSSSQSTMAAAHALANPAPKAAPAPDKAASMVVLSDAATRAAGGAPPKGEAPATKVEADVALSRMVTQGAAERAQKVVDGAVSGVVANVNQSAAVAATTLGIGAPLGDAVQADIQNAIQDAVQPVLDAAATPPPGVLPPPAPPWYEQTYVGLPAWAWGLIALALFSGGSSAPVAAK